ncbi:coiled-coil domain-containing protein 97 isoform X2 [Neophocaena asiaeorientalis asiaeorientalis]|uniref:Coiled-coil domain-containing protein 97 isoform X2 n=1 Tax=Neophocaena asiaeorientalis asiaeorientalis TaxID=1706337 RepID=A0A341DAY7_NEOAA|nr:coiled-coil domain-containing protein 97 isoform X2 [Neophocaena asiaeorientalis asiaeorientalis]
MEAVATATATATAAAEPGEGCTEPSPGHCGELSWTPVPSRPQDKAEAAEGAPRALDTDPSEVRDAAVSAMLHAVAASRLPVCSQQQGEPDLTEQEKVAILGQLYHEKPLVFLERFRTGLREEHLACFGHLRGDHRADFYCAEVARQGSTRPRTLRTRLRNRRYAALRELIQEGEYFSDEQMRFRAPLLYEQYIGQYLTLEELSARTPAQRPPKPGPPGTPACPLSDLLLQSYQERELQQRLLQQQEEEEACLEEEEEEEDSDEEDQRPDKDLEAWVPDSEERLILREEFTSRMHQHFLDGKDGDFDYSTVDDNPDFDNLDIVARDEEERYFDEEEPEDAPSPELDGD